MTAAELLPIFREQFPEFDTKSDDVILLLLENALFVHCICPMATVYLAAHVVTVDTDSGVGGSGGAVDGGGSAREVSSETAKSISTSFESMSKSDSGDSFYTATPYGRMYIILRDSCPGRRFSVRVV
jgi:hypothetical protein